MNDPGFETIDASEFEAATKAQPRVAKNKNIEELERTQTNWFSLLPTSLGECTMPDHLKVIESMGKLEIEYRRRYPVRMVFKRSDEECICRDCWIRGY